MRPSAGILQQVVSFVCAVRSVLSLQLHVALWQLYFTIDNVFTMYRSHRTDESLLFQVHSDLSDTALFYAWLATDAAGEVDHELHGSICAHIVVLLLEPLQRILHHLAGGLPSRDCGYRSHGRSCPVLSLRPDINISHAHACGERSVVMCLRRLPMCFLCFLCLLARTLQECRPCFRGSLGARPRERSTLHTEMRF